MTYLEQTIYNTYIKISRSKQNLPYRLRKDFSDFEDTEKYVYVKKLSMFFNKFPHIRIQEFFEAPYSVYPPGETYDLRFYITPKAVKAYSVHIRKLDELEPDSDIQIQFIKDSLMNIFIFCKDKKIGLSKYLDCKTNNLHDVVMHIKERRVSLYVLLCLPGFNNVISSHSPAELDFITGKKFMEELANHRTRLYNCLKVKKVCETGLDKIKKLLNKLESNI